MTDQPYQLLPALSAEEYAALRDDIAERYDPAHPVVVDEHGHVLDGHHRARICEELGITPPTVVLPGLTEKQKYEYALRANLARRHLTTLQKRELIRAELKRDGARSDRHIAHLLGVDHKTVGGVRRGGEIPHSAEKLAANAEELLALEFEGENQREATELAHEWLCRWVDWVRLWLAVDVIWSEAYISETGCATPWEWMHSSLALADGGTVGDAYEKFTRNVGWIQRAAADPSMAEYLDLKSADLGPTPEAFAAAMYELAGAP